VLVEFGDTRVLVTASVEDGVPSFLRGKGEGWVTAEYGMLPRSTHTRSAREAARGKQSGRTLEIQRLIGRSLRAVVDLRALGERTVTLDCDVLQADGARAPHRSRAPMWRSQTRWTRWCAGAPSARARCTARWRRCRWVS